MQSFVELNTIIEMHGIVFKFSCWWLYDMRGMNDMKLNV